MYPGSSPGLFFLESESLLDVASDFIDWDSYLFHRISVPYSYGFILGRIEIHANAERRADFILSSVAFAD